MLVTYSIVSGSRSFEQLARRVGRLVVANGIIGIQLDKGNHMSGSWTNKKLEN